MLGWDFSLSSTNDNEKRPGDKSGRLRFQRLINAESPLSMDSNHILLKEEVYRAQMAEIRATVLRFAESNGWEPMSRGRRAHVSIFGKVNNLDGHVDIIMEEDDWNTMPEVLLPETPFNLFCSGGVNVGGLLRRYGDTVLIWRAPFSILSETVDRFLPVAWGMLSEMTESNLLKDWHGPYENPDLPPDFGPPRKLA